MTNLGQPKTKAQITGLYLTEYDRIVKPQQRFLIPNYFIEHWVSRLGTTFAWVVISLQQACWRANDDTCIISQSALAEEIGLERRTINRILKKNPLRHWYVPTIAYQKGVVKNKTYQPLPNKYTIYLSTPLIPEHLGGLFTFFQMSSTVAEIEQAIDTLLGMKSRNALTLLADLHTQTPHPFNEPLPLNQLVEQAGGFTLTELPDDVQATLDRKLSRLHTHLTNIGHTNCRQYFRQQWLPRLGPTLAWFVMALRSSCYYNPDTGELRDTCTWRKKDLAAILGQSVRNLSNLLAHANAEYFFQLLDKQKFQLTFQVTLAEEPLVSDTPETARQLRDVGSYRKKSDIISLENQKKDHITPRENRKKDDITVQATGKKVTLPPSDRKKSDSCKYFTDSILHVVKHNNDIQTLLSEAGLSGSGLRQLCDRNPPLEADTVRAVILYAHVHSLGPGYIYTHLSHDDPVDSLFLALVKLDEPTLTLFEQMLYDLMAGQTAMGDELSVKKRVLFAEYAWLIAGFEPAEVLDLFQSPVTLLRPASRKPDASTDPAGLNALWEAVLAQLQLQMTKLTFDTWLKESQLLSREGGLFTIAVRNEQAAVWLQNRLVEMVQRVLAREWGGAKNEAVQIRFVVRKSEDSQAV